ncbi:hypothetical protein OESDEN_04633 [Oesophagostomum dentatum]|uniref:Uncharacterized protein n=1 Tax=Oesophagostomum dentatum TaxID=61180 RepID=A0A0B1TCX4_OESDE|nr:hypothetical protein OESDEN_04633 [Oesophagostomum dentatum]
MFLIFSGLFFQSRNYLLGRKDTKGHPKLNPRSKEIKKIVVVGLSDTNPSDIVPPNGTMISIPRYYSDSHIQSIVDAILSDVPKTTTKRFTSTPSRTTSAPDPRDELRCLFVGDLYNIGIPYYLHQEGEFIAAVGSRYFSLKEIKGRAGMWAYGFTVFPETPNLDEVNSTYSGFMQQLGKFEYYPEAKNPLTTSRAIQVINNLKEDDDRANCLVFISAQVDTRTLPKLNPKNKQLKRIVAVGFNKTDLIEVVGERGVSVSVPISFKTADIESVVNAILGRYIPTRRPSTTPVPSSTMPREVLKCLFVGDLYNYGKDVDKYANEIRFVDSIGRDYFGLEEAKATAGLWAYGYTTFPPSPDLNKFIGTYTEFSKELQNIELIDVVSPMSTSRAIEVINDLKDGDPRVNCLVFFSAQ